MQQNSLLASGLKECLTNSKKCLSSTSMPEIFHCHLKGRFPHPTNASVLLKCPDAGYKACLCHCKYEHMCFDVKTSTCKFEFLEDIIDCSRPLAVSFTEAVTRIHPPFLRPNLYQSSGNVVIISDNQENNTKNPPSKKKSIGHKENNIKVLAPEVKGDKKQHVEKSGDLHLTEVLHEHSLVHSNPNHKPSHLQKTTISARQISKPLKMIIQDHSFFPTWAVALVVLCIIILLVLIVLLMY